MRNISRNKNKYFIKYNILIGRLTPLLSIPTSPHLIHPDHNHLHLFFPLPTALTHLPPLHLTPHTLSLPLPPLLWKLPTLSLLLLPLPLRPNPPPPVQFYSLTVMVSYTVCRIYLAFSTRKASSLHVYRNPNFNQQESYQQTPSQTTPLFVRTRVMEDFSFISFIRTPSDSLFLDESTTEPLSTPLKSPSTISPSTFITFPSSLYPSVLRFHTKLSPFFLTSVKTSSWETSTAKALPDILRQHVHLRMHGIP